MSAPGADVSQWERGQACSISPRAWRSRSTAGQQAKVNIPADASITATVGIGPRSEGGFGITADLVISLPGVAREQAEALVAAAHQICPYSNATRNNLDVGLTVA
jgi:osmotically inducible protein OsmC